MLEINKRNSHLWSHLGPRAVYGQTLAELIDDNEAVYAISADLGGSSGLKRLMRAHPDRYMNVGIAEQNLVGVAAGLAKEGLVPFCSSFAPFITHRCADQVRMNMGYMHLNIKTVGLGSGISMSVLGNSHYGAEDLSFMRSIPGMTILSPCDCAELAMCVRAAANYQGPVYIRMTGEPGMPVVYEDAFDFQIGKSNMLCKGKDILMIATGSMVFFCLQAAKKLEEVGISATVIDMHTVKPFDTSIFENFDASYKLIVTVEEHNIMGGLGTLVCQYVATSGINCKVMNIGLPDEYLKAGSYQYMLEKYGLTADIIFLKIMEKLS